VYRLGFTSSFRAANLKVTKARVPPGHDVRSDAVDIPAASPYGGSALGRVARSPAPHAPARRRTMSTAYDRLIERIKDVYRTESVVALLEWDQETHMPPRGVDARAEQVALISGIRHETLVSPETKSLLDEATAPPGDVAAETNLREIRRQYDRAARIPTRLVKEIAHATTMAKDAWVQARKNDHFPTFAPHLTKIVALKRRVADAIGYDTEPYDALYDEFEPGARSAQTEALFHELVSATVPLLERITTARRKPDASILHRHFPRETQEMISTRMAKALSFDASSGRQDVSVHPFCTTIGGPGDVRITTRYVEDALPASMFGTMHEVGHALYEQGLPAAHRFTPAGSAISLGIHESQSRMWENLVGRSRAFWEHHYAGLKAAFPKALGDVSLDAFYGAINTVQPSFIRVEADELTYNLHVVLRFEIERGLIDGSIPVEDVPAVWSEKVRRYLGITPPTDREGCLQDIHWSMGAIGYFATYTLGNLYATQFFEQASRDIPDLMDRIRAGDNGPLLDWLRRNIHQHGMRYRAGELVRHVTGEPLSIEPYMRHVTAKFSAVYGL
jgi:carboxypeptidase Taq